MNSKPKIIVLRMREIIYTVLLVLLVILLFFCLFLMFSPGHSHEGEMTGSTEQQTVGTGETTAGTDSQSEPLTQITEQTQSDTTEQSGADQSDASGQSNAAVQSAAVQADSDQAFAAVSSSMGFTPGVYTVPVFLNDATVDVEVTVDSNHINAVRLVNLSETVETMYPLMTPALENITSQILQRQTLEGITCPQENRYTSQVLLNAISDALDIAQKDSR